MDINNWADLEKAIADCPFSSCPRYKSKKRIFFKRTGDINRVKILIISEEVGASHFCEEPLKVMAKLLAELENKKDGVVPPKIKEILNSDIDIISGNVYWTHTLKCIPPEDHLHGGSCFIFCGNFLKNEIMLMKHLDAIITLGQFAFERLRLTAIRDNVERYEKFFKMIENAPDNGYEFEFCPNRKIKVFPFVHPAFRGEPSPGVQMKESNFQKVLKTILAK